MRKNKKLSIVMLILSVVCFTLAPAMKAEAALTNSQVQILGDIIRNENVVNPNQCVKPEKMGGTTNNPYNYLMRVTGISTTLNVRSGPSTYDSIIGSLNLNEYVVEYGYCYNKGSEVWSYVKYNISGTNQTKMGWVKYTYLDHIQ